MAQFTNQAQLSYNNAVINSNVVTGEIREVLSATKTAVLDDYSRNDDVTYVISIVNSGNTPFTGVTITDDLGGYEFDDMTLYPLTYVVGSARYYINGVLQTTGQNITAGPPLVFANLTIPENGNLMIIYEVDVNQFAPLGPNDTITNTITLTSGSITTPIEAEETISTEDEPDLTITKSISPTPVTENGTITYTFVIQNSGNTAADAGDNASVRDVFDPILSNIGVTFNGVTWTEGTNYTYDEASGTFVTIPGQITVPAATYTQDPATGRWIITPGVSILVVTGTI